MLHLTVKQTGWLRFTHPSLQACHISLIFLVAAVLLVLGTEIQEVHSKLVLQLVTFEIHLGY